jgi:hypothetical protein
MGVPESNYLFPLCLGTGCLIEISPTGCRRSASIRSLETFYESGTPGSTATEAPVSVLFELAEDVRWTARIERQSYNR